MATTWDFIPKPGTTIGGWSYNEIGYTYNQISDPNIGGIVYYNGQGSSQVYINEVKKTTNYISPIKPTTMYINPIKN